jgi:predicted extracellular nuclease
LLCGALMLSGISIFQIQYTTDSGRDNTFPSVYVGKTVAVEGIVTATNYQNGGFFISETAGGPWRSIYIRSENNNVQPGDKVVIKGTVAEYYGMTCIQNLSRISVMDSHPPIPFANQIATGQITTPEQAEAYESTLVKVQNATYVQNQPANSMFTINDGSGPCYVRSNLTSEKNRLYKSGDIFASLSGIVCYAYGEYSINPRNRLDVSVMVPVFNQNRSWGRIKSIYK